MSPAGQAKIRLHQPRVEGTSVHFSWSAEHDEGFYLRPGFVLEFPSSVAVASVPQGVWQRVMLVCLHNHWVVLRPCRIEIPFTLPPDERESWLRLIDAAVFTLESKAEGVVGDELARKTRRSVELVDFGPPAGELPPTGDSGLAVASFSGGRDSVTQTAMLLEMGMKPLLVTTTSARAGSREFDTPRFRRVLKDAQAITGSELIEVKSDFRSCVDNTHPAVARYLLAVSELTDTMLYFASCLSVAWARGARKIFLAAENEVQQSIRTAGGVQQIDHFAYSIPAQEALGALLAPTGIEYRGLLSSMMHFQIQRLLCRRYPEMRGLQYSCYQQQPGESVCSRCYSCFKTAVYLMGEGMAPSEIEIDLDKVIIANADWRPFEGEEWHLANPPSKIYVKLIYEHIVRVLQGLEPETVETFAPGGLSDAGRAAYQRLRATALGIPGIPPEPGYRAGYVDLLGDPLAAKVQAIVGEQLDPADPAEYRDALANTRLLSHWLRAPLAHGPEGQAARRADH